MHAIEKFLESKYYVFTIFLITLISWMNHEINPQFGFNTINMISVYFFVVMTAVFLFFFKNTKYVVPLIFSLLFVLNKQDLTFNTTTLIFPVVSLSLLILSFVFHCIRFKIVLRARTFFGGFLLIAIAYIIPIIYIPIELSTLPVFLIGLVYVWFYVFFSNTIEVNDSDIFTWLVAINMLLVAQMFIFTYRGFFIWPDLNFFDRLFLGWLRNLGWGNLNDLTFYITLTFPSYLYFIIKKNQAIYWLPMFLSVIAIVLTKSRGGYLGFGFMFMMSSIFLIKFGRQKDRIRLLIFVAIPIITLLMVPGILLTIWEDFQTSIGSGIDFFTGNRLYIYQNGLKIFSQYPIFGAGWLSINWFPFDGRIFMFHSTIIHVLATMGLFGLFALVVHYYQILTFFKRHIGFATILFIIGYFATQVHGLIENVQFSVPYSVLLAILLSSFENMKPEIKLD